MIVQKSNLELLKYATKHKPSLIIDCSNCADPHTIFKFTNLEQFNNIYVIEVELLYAFRDVIRSLHKFISKHHIQYIIITSFNHLIHYGDKEENKLIIDHCIELLNRLPSKIIIGTDKHGTHSIKPTKPSRPNATRAKIIR